MGQRLPVVADEAVPIVLTHVGFLARRLDVGFVGKPEQEIGKRRAGDRDRICRGYSGLLGVHPGKYEGPGSVRAAKQIEFDAADIPAKANDVRAVLPGGGCRDADRLRELIVWLRLAETGEVVENQVGQAIVDVDLC